MNGIHDMGGMQGLGELGYQANAPGFDEAISITPINSPFLKMGEGIILRMPCFRISSSTGERVIIVKSSTR